MSAGIPIKEVTLQEAQADLPCLLAEVEQCSTEVAVTQAGQIVAQIVPPETDPNAVRRQFFAEAQTLRRAFHDLPTAELEEQIDQAVQAVRARRRWTEARVRACES